jgi:hypothetical protein
MKHFLSIALLLVCCSFSFAQNQPASLSVSRILDVSESGQPVLLIDRDGTIKCFKCVRTGKGNVIGRLNQ